MIQNEGIIIGARLYTIVRADEIVCWVVDSESIIKPKVRTDQPDQQSGRMVVRRAKTHSVNWNLLRQPGVHEDS